MVEMKKAIACSFSTLAALIAISCSSSNGDSPGASTGGTTPTATGGTVASSNGGSSSGGTPSSGGTTGAVSSGGASTGGANATGGSSSNGGSTQTGGTASANGGSVGNSGASGGAGGPSTGGSSTGGTPVARHGKLKVIGPQLVDEHDEPVQLKGPSSMWLNWEAASYAEDKQGLEFMRDDWHASIIRAAMGVDTTDTDDYLSDPATAKAQVEKIIQNAIDLGMYVLIDWHDSKADQHQQEATAFFTEMAQKYGSYPNVLYETFNEPTRQDWAAVIKPYHQALVEAIRAVDPDNVIVLGTRTWSQEVDAAAADPVSGTNLMYTLHFYSCTHDVKVRDKGDAALALGLPIFVTEWGATNSDGGTTKNPALCLEEAQAWHDWMNAHKISWTAWKFDNCVDKTCYFNATPPAPTSGGWTTEMLNGHAPFVRDRMRE